MSLFVCDMNCGGRVELQCKDENDFKTYGITIKVSYTVQELRREYQSGGEKSVAAMLFLLSLQV